MNWERFSAEKKFNNYPLWMSVERKMFTKAKLFRYFQQYLKSLRNHLLAMYVKHWLLEIMHLTLWTVEEGTLLCWFTNSNTNESQIDGKWTFLLCAWQKPFFNKVQTLFLAFSWELANYFFPIELQSQLTDVNRCWFI